MNDLLELSDEQVARLEEAAGQFKQQQSTLKEKALKAEAQLNDLLASDKPNSAQVKRLLRETA